MDCHQYQWDLLDQDGDKLANGIYFYKVIAEGTNEDGSRAIASEIRKLAIIQ